MEKLFQILTAIFGAVAVYFFWSDNRDYMFVAAVIGCVVFFLRVRFQVKARNKFRVLEDVTAADENDA